MEEIKTNQYPFFIPNLKIHGEIIAAAISGILILTAWVLSSRIDYALWVSLLIASFFDWGLCQGKGRNHRNI